MCVVDGVFEESPGGADVGADTDTQAVADAQSSPSKVIFHPVSAIDETAVAQVQATLRTRILRAFVGRGLLESFEAKDMLAYRHSGFSVDTSVRIEAHDRAGLERLLRYCARPAFSLERLRKAGNELVYRCAKQRSEPASDRRANQRGVNNRGVRADELTLTPLELINRIAALVPPPRTHRHRYYGALAPNSPLRAAVTAMAQEAPSQPVKVPAEPATAECDVPTQSEPAPFRRSQAHYLWAVLIARIYKVFPLLCPLCGGQMRIIAFITHSADIRQMLVSLGVPAEPPCISPPRGPPMWEDCDAQMGEGAQVEPDWANDWAGAAQPAPDYELDQRINW